MSGLQGFSCFFVILKQSKGKARVWLSYEEPKEKVRKKKGKEIEKMQKCKSANYIKKSTDNGVFVCTLLSINRYKFMLYKVRYRRC